MFYVAGSDKRVKAAAPSVGGSGFRTCAWPLLPQHKPQLPNGDLQLYRATLEFESYAPLVKAPLLWLGATNDFHGIMDDTYRTGALIPHQDVRYAFTPHMNHQFTPEFAVDFTIPRRTWLLGVGGLLAAGPLAAASPSPDRLKDAAEKGREFLRDLCDPSLDLLPEFRGSSVYWLYHDNNLAAKVLEKSHPDVSQKITKAILRFGIKESGKIKIVFGEAKQSLPFRHYQLKEVRRIGSKRVVKTEVVTDKAMDGWEGCADLLFLAALADKEPAEAKRHLQRGLPMWDGTGFIEALAADHAARTASLRSRRLAGRERPSLLQRPLAGRGSSLP